MGNINSEIPKLPCKRAILQYSNNESYNGEVENGLRHGFGTYFYENGERFEGLWYKNVKHGI